jgi:hypothetical protein
MNVGASIREWFGAGLEIPFRLEPRRQPLDALHSSDELPDCLIRLFEDGGSAPSSLVTPSNVIDCPVRYVRSQAAVTSSPRSPLMVDELVRVWDESSIPATVRCMR